MIKKYLHLYTFWAPVFFFLVLTILGLMWPGYNPITTGMSELGAVDSPYQHLMNYLGFSFLGLNIIIFALGYGHHFIKNIPLLISALLSLVAGVLMFLVGFLPCDAGCVDVTTIGQLHSQTSTVPAILMPLGAMISAYPLSKLWGKKWGYTAFYLGLLSMMAGPLMFMPGTKNLTGLIQRLGIGLSLVWMMLVSHRIQPRLK